MVTYHCEQHLGYKVNYHKLCSQIKYTVIITNDITMSISMAIIAINTNHTKYR